MDSYLHQSRGCDSPSDSEHESSEENVVGGVVKRQQMFIWNTEYEVRVTVVLYVIEQRIGRSR